MANAVEALIRRTVGKGIGTVAEFNRSRMKAITPNAYLSGIHEPMKTEVTIEGPAVTGTLPAELDGRYIRIGPNPATPQNHEAYHWFSGDGMVHGVRLKDGKALWYRNRWIRSTSVAEHLGEPPAPGPRGAFDTVNTNVLGHAGSTWALVEAGGSPVRIDEELNTIAYDKFGDTLKGTFTAHPHLDPDSGEMHAICYDAQVPGIIRHVVVNNFGKVRREERITVQDGPSIHDCMITQRYVIILDLPVTFSMKRLLAGYKFPYAWNPDHKARVGLLPREGKDEDVIWCDVEPCYVFHPANAFDNPDGTVTMDVCAHNSMFADSTRGPDSQSVPFERWTIDPAAQKVTRKTIDAASQEFPRPNERLIGKPYRYVYTVALPEGGDASFMNKTELYKHDLEASVRQVHDFGEGRVPGEFIFVERKSPTSEDDGWLMGYVIDQAKQTTNLVILDAQNFTGDPVASVHLPHRVPPGFHGNWIASK